MKQKYDKFRISSMRITAKIASRYKVLAACILLAMTLSTSIRADSLYVTIGADSIHFSTFFEIEDYMDCGDFFLDGSLESWNPYSSCLPKPTKGVVLAKAKSHAHFKILSPDGSCVLLNALLQKETGSNTTGNHPLEMSMPINQTLTNTDFIFESTSFWDALIIYWQEADFQVERGQSYVFQITEQTDRCPPEKDGEETRGENLAALPCQTDDCCDVAGDANNDGSVSALDLTFLVDYFYRSGGDPDCFGQADANGDCSFDEDGDLNYMLAYIFTGGPAPVCPSP